MVEIDKQFSETGMSSPLVVHQRTTYSHRNRNRIRTTPICQNRPMVRTSRTNTDSPAGCIISEERGRGGGVQTGGSAGCFKAFCEERGGVQVQSQVGFIHPQRPRDGNDSYTSSSQNSVIPHDPVMQINSKWRGN